MDVRGFLIKILIHGLKKVSKRKKTQKSGPEMLRDLGPTNPPPDFIPMNVGTPSNQPQNYDTFPTYPFVNVYKRFVYG